MNCFKRDRDSYFLDQSESDSLSRVRFARKSSLMEISRWGGEASLTFAPGEKHEGTISVRGNEIVLKSESTPKSYHVFRKLDGERFEYDVVLLREPETNVIEIELAFPEGLEFYKQPSSSEIFASPFRCSPEVIDSYAVYWKERNGPYKTGKFCHIYRPLIRDARGRTVWGELDITGSCMTITIPEGWLSDAVYPVVVDPVIGTQSRGALNMIDWYGEGESDEFFLELQMGLSKFTASSPIKGLCTSYLYSYKNVACSGQAALFSDSGGKPHARRSSSEQLVSLQRATPSWVSSTFTVANEISIGTPFWYGYFTPSSLYTYYDAVGSFKRMNTDSFSTVPDIYNEAWNTETWAVLMSAYFSYSVSQAVTRLVVDTAYSKSVLQRKKSSLRICRGFFNASEVFRGRFDLRRIFLDTAGIVAQFSMIQTLFRFCMSGFRGVSAVIRSIGFSRILVSCLSFFEGLLPRMILKKEEVIIVSRITREFEFKGHIL